MNDRPTPETDAEHAQFAMGGFTLDFCRKLERERDEAREVAAKWESSFDAMERAGAEQARRADENREWALKAERERDEAIADRDILRIDAQREAEHHDRMVGELEKVYKERDEAMDKYAAEATDHMLAVNKLCNERDEARNKTADALQEVDLRTLDYLRLREAIIATLEENRHLADGDDCTLAKLKSVVPEWK